MANKKSNHLENHAEIEHEIDVNKDLDLAKQDTTENEHVDPKVEDKQATMQHKENENRQSSASTPNETVIVKKKRFCVERIGDFDCPWLGRQRLLFRAATG